MGQPQGMGFQGNFHWWEGVVEDNLDPLGIGRCRVRVYGWHTNEKVFLPTEDLPWAYPVMPLNTPNNKTYGIKIGTRVFGFMRDGISGQDLVMMGTVNTGYENPGKGFDEEDPMADPPSLASNTPRTGDYGFIDDREGAGSSVINGQPRKSQVTMTATSSSYEDRQDYYPLESGKNESNTNRLSRGQIEGTISEAHSLGISEVTKASSGSISEPANPYAALYPFNSVEESESGHYREVDDTPGAERIKETHRTGTFYEIHPDGTKVTKVVKDDFSVTIGDKGVKVEGICAVHVVGQADFYCESDITVKTDSAATVSAGTTATVKAGTDATVSAEGDATVEGKGNVKVLSEGNLDIHSGGLMTFKDSSIGGSTVPLDTLKKDIDEGRRVD
jgi:hypothetical protein